MEDKFIITDILRVAMVEKGEYPEKKTSFGHRLEGNELIFHFSGHSTVYFDDLILETKPGTIRFLPEGKTKRYDVDRHEAGDCIFVSFHADRVLSHEAFVLDVGHNEKIGTLFKKLFSTWVGKNEGYFFQSLSLLYSIFAQLQNDYYVPKAHYTKIKPALSYIHEHFLREEITVDTLASMCDMKVSYFHRLFKEKYGVSPKKYIIGLKINHACELLRLERYTVTQIADLCNFSDIYFFSRQFKEYMGITPTQFINKYRSSK